VWWWRRRRRRRRRRRKKRRRRRRRKGRRRRGGGVGREPVAGLAVDEEVGVGGNETFGWCWRRKIPFSSSSVFSSFSSSIRNILLSSS